MLKIGKGLKKKKKSKKHKKDEELFTQEELEQYRREHQQRNIITAGAAASVSTTNTTTISTTTTGACSSGGEQGTSTSEDGGGLIVDNNEHTKPQDQDEWKKFNELTTGIDSILKKTQGDLDRIKSTSFFKRTPPPKPSAPPKQLHSDNNKQQTNNVDANKHWIDFKENQQQSQSTSISTLALTKTTNVNVNDENIIIAGVIEETGSEYESEEDDNIFDTSYVDVVASGEIKLAYIPDSPDPTNDPTNENDIDPFDTSAADKIIRGPEISKKGKRLVSIGSAVEVLTGRIDPHILPTHRRSIRHITKPNDLLLDDVNQIDIITTTTTTPPQIHTDTNGNEIVQVVKSLLDDDNDEHNEDRTDKSIPIDLSVSSTSQTQQILNNITTDYSDTTNNHHILDLNEFEQQQQQQIFDDLDDEFASLAAESLKTVKPVLDSIYINKTNEPPINIERDWNAFDGTTTNTNTTTTTSTTTITSITTNSINNSDERITINHYNQLQEPQKDLLGGSNTDLSQLHDTILPIKEEIILNDNNIEDPFDTSSIDKINIHQPGKIELKFIEAELLGETNITFARSLSDPDFNPRQDEYNTSCILIKKQQQTNLLIEDNNDTDNELAELASVPSLQTPALKPVIKQQDVLEFEEDNDNHIINDPFDTSFIATVVPGKAELKLIENELAELETNIKQVTQQQQLEHILKRSEKESYYQSQSQITDLLFVDEQEINTKVLTPLTDDKHIDELSYTDPFDTSNNAYNILPGKAELKLLENELLTIQTTSTKTLSTSSSTVVIIESQSKQTTSLHTKPLTIADDLLSSSDYHQHFNQPELQPLTPFVKSLTTTQQQQSEQKEEAQVDFDPFDTTSVTTDLVPGIVELKIIESELIQ